MGNKMKKLICALLASAMLVSSVGITVFADADKVEDENDTTITATATPEATQTPGATASPEATKAPETTASPEVTAAPEATKAPTGTAYDTDTYYQKALSLCSSLGIISGYEDGSVQPESKVTRAEMASIVLRMLAINSTSKYQGSFSDVDASHWAADQIQTAMEQGIVSGMGDGTFLPDGEVTYAQVVVMLVNAMNYAQDAAYIDTKGGHWASGYMSVAAMSSLDLLNNAPGSSDVASERGTVIKMAYNALLGSYKEITGHKNGAPVYSVKTDEDGNDTTLAKAKFNIKQAKGVMSATAKTNISGNKMQEGEIEIQDKDKVYKTFDCKLTGLEEYLGQKITYFYKENSGLAPEVLAVTYDTSKTTVEDIDADDIDEITGFDTNSGSIKVNKVSKKKDCTGATVIYNGKILEDADKAAISDLNAFLTPDKGDVRLIDSDKDGVFDVVFINAYEIMVVTSATQEKLIGKEQKIGGALGETEGVTINLDDEIDRTVTVTRNGIEVKVRNLKKNDVATIKRSYDNSVVDIVVTGESVTGSASGISTKMDASYATIGGTKYDVANVAVGDLKTGAQCVFYFDKFGRIAYIEGGGTGRLESGEKYGWLMDIYKDESSSDKIVKIMTQDGSVGEYKFASKVSYWAPNQTTIGTTEKTAAQMETEVEKLLSDDAFPHMWVGTRYTDGTTADGERRYSWDKSHSIRLVKYKANSSGKLTKLYGAVNIVNEAEKYYSQTDYIHDDGKYIKDPYVNESTAAALKASDALIVDMTNKSGRVLSGGLVAGYAITDDAFEFGVPDKAENFRDESAYKVANVVASKYNVSENGPADTYIVADFDGRTPAVIIKYMAPPDVAVNPTDFDTAGNTPAMIVDSISMAIDEDDETIYTIEGYQNGSKTSVTTKRTSALGEIVGYNGTRNYKLSDEGVMWTGDSNESLTKYLHKGDIIITDGTTILLYACAENVYSKLKADPNAAVAKNIAASSDTRNGFMFDAVVDSEVDDTSWMSIGGSLISADTSLSMDVVEIDLSRDVDDAIDIIEAEASIADVMNYVDGEGDFAFARTANKGRLQEVIIYRIKK